MDTVIPRPAFFCTSWGFFDAPAMAPTKCNGLEVLSKFGKTAARSTTTQALLVIRFHITRRETIANRAFLS
jgi:hypothetical protein